MAEDLNVARIRDTLDLLDLKITALNRGFIMLLNVLQNENVLNENTVLWVDKIKRDPDLAKTIDKEGLMDKALDAMAKLSCPDSGEEAKKVLRSHVVRAKPIKARLPKLPKL